MKSKRTALILCLTIGVIGGHWFYLRRYRKAKNRIAWFIFCNPVAFYKTGTDAVTIYQMTDYTFKNTYQDKIHETGSYRGLHEFLNKIEAENK